jgi:hypothetical protein
MKTCLKYCTPIAAAMFVCVVGWQYLTRGSLTNRGYSLGEVRETFIQGGGRVRDVAPVLTVVPNRDSQQADAKSQTAAEPHQFASAASAARSD